MAHTKNNVPTYYTLKQYVTYIGHLCTRCDKFNEFETSCRKGAGPHHRFRVWEDVVAHSKVTCFTKAASWGYEDNKIKL